MNKTLLSAVFVTLALVGAAFLGYELFTPREFVLAPDSSAALSVPSARAVAPAPQPARAELADWIKASTRVQPEFGAFAQWTGRWVAAAPVARTALLQEGVALSEQRRVALRRMIPSDPRSALEAAVPYEIRKSLPAQVVARLEQPVAGGADYAVSIRCGGDHEAAGHTDDVTREVRIGDQIWLSFTYADRLTTTSKHGMSVHGIAIDELLAMHENPVRRLSTTEAADRGLDPAVIHVEMAGKIQALGNETALLAWTSALTQDERRLGPFSGPAYRAAAAGNPLPPANDPAPSPDGSTASSPTTGIPGAESAWTEGAKTMLYIRARFADEAVGFEPLALGTAQSYQGVVDTFWQNASYGKTSLTTTFTDVVALPSNAAVYTNAFSTLLADARNAAAAANAAWNTVNYDLYVVVTSNKASFAYAGYAYVGSAGVHLRSDYASLRTAGHEYGHNLGLWHANYWRTDSTSPIGRDCIPGGYVNDSTGTEWIEYGHRFSLMSAQSTSEFSDAAKPHYSVVEKGRLDWLTATGGLTTLTSTPATGTMVRIYRQDHPSAVNTRGLKIDQPSSDYTTTTDASKRRYWLSYRRAFNSGTPASYAPYGIEVDWSQPSYSTNGAIQLDMTPFTRNVTTFINGSSLPGSYWTIDNTDKEDAMQPMGLTYSDPAGIHFTPLAYGDDDATANNGNEWIEVDVRLGTFPGNAAPVVTLSASTTTPAVNESVTFTATASDADGDALSYWWDFGDNSVVTSSFNSATATKSWSSAGVRVVRVIVSDRKGGQTIAIVPVSTGSPANNYEIRGRVLRGGTPVAGARVNIGTTYQTWTDSLGRYILAGLPSGSHTLACRKDGLTFTAQFTNPVSTATASQYGKDFYANEALAGGGGTYSISGTVTNGGSGLAGVAVEAGGHRATTDGSGAYIISGLTPGTYTVTAGLAPFTFTPSNRSVTLTSASSAGQDFSVVRFTVSGNFTDVPNSPLPTVFLLDGTSVSAKKLGNDINYSINVPVGTYHLCATLAGYSITPSFTNPLNVTGNLTSQGFTCSASSNTNSVSGQVTFSGQPLAGVTMTLTGAANVTTTTDTGGRYRFSNLSTTSSTVTPTKSGYTFSPAASTVTPGASTTASFTAGGSGATAAPSVSNATATPSPTTVPGTVTLAATATGGGTLSYHWSATIAPGPVTFSVNNSPSAATTVATLAAAGSYSFSVIVTNANGFTASRTVSMTAASSPATLVVTPYEVSVPVGGMVDFNTAAFDTAGSAVTLTPTFSVSGGGTINASTGLFTASTVGIHTVTATAGSLTASATVTVTANGNTAPPAITTQPTDRSINEGENTTFTVGAFGGTPLTYQWRKAGVNLANGGCVSNATTASLTITGALPADAGNYDCVATNAAGSATSNPAVLTVNDAPQVNPGTAPAATVGVAANLAGTSSDDGLPSGSTLTSTWSLISGPGTATFANANSASTTVIFSATGDYLLRLTATDGSATVFQDLAVTVSVAAPVITSQPQAQAVTVGQTANFSVTATGAGTLTYQWHKGGATLNGASSSTYSIASPVVTDAGSYTVVVTNAGGSTTSDAVTLTVNKATPVITQAPVAAMITYGQTLANATLSGGAASVAGTFAFTSPATVPNAGTVNQAVTFTPADTANYNPLTVPVSVMVNKATPVITQVPIAAAITYGQTLASATLSGGTASVAGTFAFASPATVPNAGTANQTLTFTPADTANYNSASVQVGVTVNPIVPMITEVPVATAITYGQTLAEATLSGGTALVEGTFAFTNPDTTPNAGTANQLVTFTPADTANYAPVTVQVIVTVQKATPVITEVPVAAMITYGETLAEATLSGGMASVAGTFAFANPGTAPDAGTADQAVTFTPADTANHNTVSVPVSVTVNPATPVITELPVAAAITYGQTLAEATLSGGTTSVAGTFDFTSPGTAPDAGTEDQAVTFTPTDTANHNPVTVQVSVTVNPTTPVITELPVAAAIVYGQTLAEATLSGGTASVTGTFAFASPASAPTAGTANHAVTFTPADTSNYNPVTVQVSVTISPGTPTGTEKFSAWISGFDGLGGQTAPTDDADGDGIENFMEYALAGGDPGRSDSRIRPAGSIMTQDNQNYLALTVRKNPDATGISFNVEVSGDLAKWNSGAGHTVVVSETAYTLIVRDNTPVGGGSTGRYLRLKVSSEQP